jgi:signal transduction histidine kinase
MKMAVVLVFYLAVTIVWFVASFIGLRVKRTLWAAFVFSIGALFLPTMVILTAFALVVWRERRYRDEVQAQTDYAQEVGSLMRLYHFFAFVLICCFLGTYGLPLLLFVMASNTLCLGLAGIFLLVWMVN